MSRTDFLDKLQLYVYNYPSWFGTLLSRSQAYECIRSSSCIWCSIKYTSENIWKWRVGVFALLEISAFCQPIQSFCNSTPLKIPIFYLSVINGWKSYLLSLYLSSVCMAGRCFAYISSHGNVRWSHANPKTATKLGLFNLFTYFLIFFSCSLLIQGLLLGSKNLFIS